MITKTQSKAIEDGISAIVDRLDCLYETDITSEIVNNHLIVTIDGNAIEYFINDTCSMREWVSMINMKIYYKTRCELDYNPVKNEVYLELDEASYADAECVVSKFLATTKIVLNTIDECINGEF